MVTIMSKKSRREYLISIKKRYESSGKLEKKTILNEFCSCCGYNRKYAIRILNCTVNQKPAEKLIRKKKYDNEELKNYLFKTWKASNLPCGKRLKPIIDIWLPKYIESGGKLTKENLQLLETISAATIDRILKPIRHRYKKKGLSTTKPGSIIRDLIPIRTNQCDEKRIGYLEADTVAHCGNSVAGMFTYSLNMVDIATGWSIQRAMWGKGEYGVLEALKTIEGTLPFKIKGFDSDNGSEFLNWPLLKYFKHRKSPVTYTRSRSYHKNDNAHIEGKNWTLIRQYLGYERFDNPKIVKLLNDFYRTEWYYFINFFLTSSKLIKKERVGSKILKKYDKPQTPYERLLKFKEIDKDVKEVLRLQFKKLNPYDLEKQIQKKIGKIYALIWR
jgi:hypothetical protein